MEENEENLLYRLVEAIESIAESQRVTIILLEQIKDQNRRERSHD